MLVAVKDSRKGFIRISLSPKSRKNLNKLHTKLKYRDKSASWFYHASGKIILNGPRGKQGVVASHLNISDLADIIANIK